MKLKRTKGETKFAILNRMEENKAHNQLVMDRMHIIKLLLNFVFSQNQISMHIYDKPSSVRRECQQSNTGCIVLVLLLLMLLLVVLLLMFITFYFWHEYGQGREHFCVNKRVYIPANFNWLGKWN